MLAAAGLIQGVIGFSLVTRFKRRGRGAARAAAILGRARPAITVLKPLAGDEPLLEEALSSIFAQDYPEYQVVLGVQDAADPAIEVVRRVQARFPGCDSTLVVNPTQHGRNRKVGNLMNMLPSARHDVLVIADSDVHAAPDYLDSLARALAAQPRAGLVTTIYAGLPASGTMAGRLGASGITHGFLPGALISRALGREDCLGATMALRREVLEALGGLRAIVDDLADDAALGRRVRELQLGVALADTVPATTVAETSLVPLFWHELRWARVIRTQVPASLALSTIQYPLAWAALAVVASGGAEWTLAVFLTAWIGRAAIAAGIDRALGLSAAPTGAEAGAGAKAGAKAGADPGRLRGMPVGLLPLRDLLSVAVVLASYFSRRVRWRGQVLYVKPRGADIVPIAPAIDGMTFGTERP